MTPWNLFYQEKIQAIFTEKKVVLDVGCGLRSSVGWSELPRKTKTLVGTVGYKTLDRQREFHPDIVGDIHKLPLEDNSQDAVLCLGVLEHVENPFVAVQEIFRVLKSDGYCLVYVPFLYYYHSNVIHYKDYWRFTKDAIPLLFKDFSYVEIQGVRGAIACFARLTRWGRSRILMSIAMRLDIIFNSVQTDRVSGYYIFLKK
jgi:ubiquinone/menaquinone biosynthesis C-methylase UbiE